MQIWSMHSDMESRVMIDGRALPKLSSSRLAFT